MLIRDCDYFVRVIPFPPEITVNGILVLNDDDTYSVYLNSRASEEQRREALHHELRHIARNDLYDIEISNVENL